MLKRVAVIGLSFRFPGTDTKNYWEDLINEKNLVTQVDPSRWALEEFLHPKRNHPGTSYSFSAGSIGDVSGFDAAFFGISPREAALMDPQQRILLELSWEAMENAGVPPSQMAGSRCGVFVGVASTDYSFRLADDLGTADSTTATGNAASIAANRISYVFDLRGPSMVIDTACSSSLVAFHQACQSIRSGESDMALAGGISLHLHPYGFIVFSKASMLSRKGMCNVFDAEGDGYVRSEGGGLFLLKDYDQAVRDGDRILAVVANSRVNADGKKTGLTIPSHQMQAQLLEEAYSQAGITPQEISYIEAHGTGTAVGDPIETRALSYLGQNRDATQPLFIGSVKSNLGHMEAASGVAGLVKAIYALQHREIPATIGLKKPNPNIPFEEWNLSVVTARKALPETGRLIIGCNSFGFGGANAHVILESYEPKLTAPSKQKKRKQSLPLVVSGKDEKALAANAEVLESFLQRHPNLELYDVAYQNLFRREVHPHRAVFWGTELKGIQERLAQYVKNADLLKADTGIALKGTQLAPAFVYSGNGSQWQGMGAQLLADKVFSRAVTEVDSIFQQYADYSIVDELKNQIDIGRYALTEVAQPTLFALQVGITQMLREQGIMPSVVTGHSVGEVAAAWAAGALTLADAVKVIYFRSHYQGTTSGLGKMTAVAVGEEAIHALLQEAQLTEQCSVAGINSVKGVTIAAPVAILDQFEAFLSERRVWFKRLDLDYAFHSPAMDSIEEGVRTSLADIQPGATTIPFYSTVTGEMLAGESLDAEYWWKNIRYPVLFEPAINAIQKQGVMVFVEVGPHPVLRSYLLDCLKANDNLGRVIATVKRGDDAPQRIQETSSQVIASGAKIDWTVLFQKCGAFLNLPLYQWQRERFWHPVTTESQGLLYRKHLHPLLGYKLAQHDLTWEIELDTVTHPVLADHVVGEATVFPGAGFVELALAAATLWHPTEHIEIEQIEIRAPLLLSQDNAKQVRFSIQPQDGSFKITGREIGSAEEAVLHAVGRILVQPKGLQLDLPAFVEPSHELDFDGELHYALADASGLAYGPAFRAVKHGWVDNVKGAERVSAVLQVPQEISADLSAYHLHPALLDSAFQLVIQLLKGQLQRFDGLTFVPTMVERVTVLKTSAVPHYVEVILLSRAPHSLSANVRLYAEDGTSIAVLKNVRLRSVRLQHHESKTIRFVDYHFIPQPLALQSQLADAQSHQTLVAHQLHINLLEALAAKPLQSQQATLVDEMEPLLDSLANHFVAEAYESLAKEAQNPVSAYHDLLQSMLTENGAFLSKDESANISAQMIWQNLIAEYPDYFSMIHAVGRVGMHLPTLLTGEQVLEDALPRNASYAQLMQAALGSEGEVALAKAITVTLSKALETLPKGQRFNVMEVSAAASNLVTDIYAVLVVNCAEYCFASCSETAIAETERLAETYPSLHTKTFDHTETSVEKTAQLLILHLNFPTLQATMRALRFAAAHLAEGGILLVVGMQPAPWIDFVLGNTQNWWTATEEGLTVSSQQTDAFWCGQLEQAGFTELNQQAFTESKHTGVYVIAARGGKEQLNTEAQVQPTQPRHWLLMTGNQGLSTDLAAQLQAQLQSNGDLLSITNSQNSNEIVTAIQTASAKSELSGIIYLEGLDDLSVKVNPEQDLIRQVQRCATIAALAQACEQVNKNTTCWIVTSQAAPELISATNQKIDNDASLWGFTRTLMNESANFSVRLLDIHAAQNISLASQVIQSELAKVDQEQEVVILEDGSRWVPRMKFSTDPALQSKQETDSQATTVRLGFHAPGQLRHLQWEVHPNQELLEDEVEVSVRATGLNFRDVMYSLGLLADEAIENGFAGPSLGLEFSGVVTHIGTQVKAYKVGDQVVGFGPSSFSDKVIARQHALSLIPEGMSYEAAATIPSTFFTVYYALHHLARLSPGEKILIHGAAGGVGIAAIQIANWCGAEIYATAGSDEKRDFLRMMGVTHIYDSRSLSFSDEILQQTEGKGVDVILNSLAGEAIQRNFNVLKPFGRFLELGKRDFYENTKVGLRPFRNNISYFGIDADQLMSVRPDLTHTLFREMMALFEEGVLHPLPYQAFEADQVVEAFRYMQQAKQIGKIVVTYRKGINQIHQTQTHLSQTLTLPSDASYMVTGGLSGFGLKTALWLAEKGAKNLVLLSRKGAATDEAKAAIATLQEQGVKVLALNCDVTKQADIASVFDTIAKTLPPLKGIVHAAMVIDDGLIRNTQAEQIKNVFAPKILGARYLHELSLNLALDFFVLYSSGTTLFGNPGQASYVAANTWLEALAVKRRQQGLPATCVRWGAIDDVGFLARNEKIKDALQSRMGGSALLSSEALKALETMILAGRSGDGVLEMDWRALSKFLPSANTPKFSEMARLSGNLENDEGNAQDIQQMLLELSDSELLERFQEILKHEIGNILRVAPEKIDSQKSIYDMGLDSLMGVELVVALEERFGVRIPVMALSENQSVEKLSERILSLLRGAGDHSEENAVSEQIQQVAALHSAEVDQQSLVQLVDEINGGQHATSKMIH